MRPRSLRKECMLAKPVSSDHTGTLKLLTATATAANANGTLSPISCPFHSQPQLESCVCRECQIFQAGSMVLCVARCEMLRARQSGHTLEGERNKKRARSRVSDLEQRLLVDALAINNQALDGGIAALINRNQRGKLFFADKLFQLPPPAFRNKKALDAIV